MNNLKRRSAPISVLLCVIALGAGLRCLAMGKPYLGNFGAYQLTVASVARFFQREHFAHLLSPRQDTLVNGAPGLQLHYYPVASVIAGLLSYVSNIPLEVSGRLQAILFSLGVVWLLYLIGARIRDPVFGLIAASVYAIAPVSIIYGQSFMNESAGVFFVVLALYAFLRAREEIARNAWVLVGVLAAGLAIVTRLNGFYLFVPLFFLWAWGTGGLQPKKIGSCIGLCLAAGILPLAWYGYTYFVVQTNPHVFVCMFPQLGRQATGGSLNAEFVRVLLKTIATLDFTPLGLPLLLLGLWREMQGAGRKNLWLYAWFFAVLASFVTIPQKIIDHNFYTLHLVPPGAFFIAGAVQWLRTKVGKGVLAFLAVAVLLGSARYFYHPVMHTVLPGNRDIIAAAQGIQTIVPPDAKLIAASGSANSLLYYCDRRGWDFMVQPPAQVPYQFYFRWRFCSPEEKERRAKALLDPSAWLEHLRSQGAQYFAVAGSQELDANPRFRQYLLDHYPQVSEPQTSYLVFDLRKPKGKSFRQDQRE